MAKDRDARLSMRVLHGGGEGGAFLYYVSALRRDNLE